MLQRTEKVDRLVRKGSVTKCETTANTINCLNVAVPDAGIAKIPPKHVHVRLISDSKLTFCVSTVISW